MFEDIATTARHWRVVHLIGVTAMRARYARSRLGQFWLVLSGFFQVLIIGVVWAFIWRQSIDAFLPYYGVGQILFAFVTQTINAGSTTLIGDAKYFRNDKMPFMVSIFANIYRNALVLLHNVPIIVVLPLWSDTARFRPGWGFMPALALSFVFTLLCSYIAAVLCARFRDLIQIVAIVLQNVFLLTPVMWKLDVVPERYQFYVFCNPFACVLELVRNPLVGLSVNPIAYWILAGWCLLLTLAALLLHKRLADKLIFWI